MKADKSQAENFLANLDAGLKHLATFTADLERFAIGTSRQIENIRTALQNLTDLHSRYCESQYRETGNPLFVWQAYRLSRTNGAAPPSWVFEYLDQVAGRFELLERDARKGGLGKEPAAAIAEALEMKTEGAGTVFSRKNFQKDIEWFLCSSAVYREVQNGSQETYAVEAVAKNNRVSQSRVWRHWRRGKRQLGIE